MMTPPIFEETLKMTKYETYELEKRALMYKLLDTCTTSEEYQKEYDKGLTKLITKFKI